MSNSITDRILAINKQVSSINIQREKNLSTKGVYISQLEELCKTYKDKYGVELTAETIEAERQKVLQETEVEVQLLEQVISAINDNNIGRANELLGITKKEVSQQPEVSSVQQPTVNVSDSQIDGVDSTPQSIPSMNTVQQEQNVVGTIPPLVPDNTYVEEDLSVREDVPEVPSAPTVETEPSVPYSKPQIVPPPSIPSSEPSNLEMPQAPSQGQVASFTPPNLSNIKPAVIPKADSTVNENPSVGHTNIPTPPPPVVDDDEEGDEVDGSTQSKAMSFNSILNGTAFSLDNL